MRIAATKPQPRVMDLGDRGTRVRQLEKSALIRLQHALDNDPRPLKRRRDLADAA